MPEYTIRVSTKGLFFNEKNELVLIKSPNGDYWSSPGGGLEDNESLKDAVERELLEETGLEGVAEKVVFVQEYINHRGRKQIEVFFRGKIIGISQDKKPEHIFKYFDKDSFSNIKYYPEIINPFKLDNSIDYSEKF